MIQNNYKVIIKKQFCFLELFTKDQINLKANGVTYPTFNVGQYKVKGWLLDDTKDGSGVTLSFILTRNLQTIFMVTYLPTLLMNVMNQAMVYIQTDNKLDLIVSVNITCMMVLASMYLSVASSLPSTTKIKPIEIWLLFNMMYPVFVILSNVILQVFIVNFI